MGRWRPPQEKSSPYITPEGYARLQREQQQLWQKRNGVRDALSAAAAEGDRSENAEYIYRKKQLAEIDRRIRYLQKRLPDLNVVAHVGNTRQILFGARVLLECDDGRELNYRIVGADEIGEGEGYISVDSPMARALLKKTVDDEVSLTLNNQQTGFVILAISYE